MARLISKWTGDHGDARNRIRQHRSGMSDRTKDLRIGNTGALALAILRLAGPPAWGTEIPAADRRSGYDFMSPETRAMQDDDKSNPGMLWVLDGEAMWNSKDGASNLSCADCHTSESMRGVATHYPTFEVDYKRPVDLGERINICRERLTPFLDIGRELFERRQGQLNISCAQCHDDNWGKRSRRKHYSPGTADRVPALSARVAGPWLTPAALPQLPDWNAGGGVSVRCYRICRARALPRLARQRVKNRDPSSTPLSWRDVVECRLPYARLWPKRRFAAPQRYVRNDAIDLFRTFLLAK